MSYEHIKVSDVETEESKFIGATKVAAFIEHIRNAMPYLKLRAKVINAREYILYTDDNPYALCKVGVGVYPTERAPDILHFESRKVTNEMCRKYTEAYYRMRGDDPKKFAKKVIPFIREYSAVEMATIGRATVRVKIEAAKNQLSQNHAALFNGVTKWDNIVAEVSGLIAKGVEFVTPEFRDFAVRYEEILREANAERNQPVNMYFVRIISSDSVTGKVLVVPVRAAHTYSPQFGEEQVYDQTNIDKLPSVIPERLKVLHILEAGQYVHRIGTKVDDAHYWIEM